MKVRIESGLCSEELLVMTFSNKSFNSLNWLNEREFERNGDLFDVVHFKQLSNGNIELKCISDLKEKELFRQFANETVNSFGEEDNPTPICNWMKLLHSPSICAEINNCFQIICFDLKSEIAVNYQFMFSDAEITLESPPPCILVDLKS